MKCADCKHYKKPDKCYFYPAILAAELILADSAEKDCVGFERKAEVSR